MQSDAELQEIFCSGLTVDSAGVGTETADQLPPLQRSTRALPKVPGGWKPTAKHSLAEGQDTSTSLDWFVLVAVACTDQELVPSL
jgi:hypothetical protein